MSTSAEDATWLGQSPATGTVPSTIRADCAGHVWYDCAQLKFTAEQ